MTVDDECVRSELLEHLRYRRCPCKGRRMTLATPSTKLVASLERHDRRLFRQRQLRRIMLSPSCREANDVLAELTPVILLRCVMSCLTKSVKSLYTSDDRS